MVQVIFIVQGGPQGHGELFRIFIRAIPDERVLEPVLYK